MQLILPLYLTASATTTAATLAQPQSAPAFNCAAPTPNTCTFYTACLEPSAHCGSDGYPLGYGDKYCTAFQHTLSTFTPAGQAWVNRTMGCLQHALIPYLNTAIGCEELRKAAFASHPKCYVDSGLCSLSPSDWESVVETVNLKTLFESKEAVKATLEAADGCVDFYALLVKEGVLEAKKWWESWWPW